MEADIMRQKEATDAAKREPKLELARLGNLDDHTRGREDEAKEPKIPWMPAYTKI